MVTIENLLNRLSGVIKSLINCSNSVRTSVAMNPNYPYQMPPMGMPAVGMPPMMPPQMMAPPQMMMAPPQMMAPGVMSGLYILNS
jgi:hypothetical protein